MVSGGGGTDVLTVSNLGARAVGGCGLRRLVLGLWAPALGPPRDAVRCSSGPGCLASVGGAPLLVGPCGQPTGYVSVCPCRMNSSLEMGRLCQQKAPPVVSGGL